MTGESRLAPRAAHPSPLVAVVGPESTGKTTLARGLAAAFGVPWLPEFAREYLERRQARTGSPDYVERDLEVIAREHVRRERRFAAAATAGGVLDTDLAVMIVWWNEKYGGAPSWVHDALARQAPRLYLVCRPDLEWRPDPLRESRHDLERLFDAYLALLAAKRLPCEIVGGRGEARLEAAVAAAAPILRRAEARGER